MNGATTAVSTKRLLCVRRNPGFITRCSIDADSGDNGVNPVRLCHGDASVRNASDLSCGNVQRPRSPAARLELSFSGNEATNDSPNDSKGKRYLFVSTYTTVRLATIRLSSRFSNACSEFTSDSIARSQDMQCFSSTATWVLHFLSYSPLVPDIHSEFLVLSAAVFAEDCHRILQRTCTT